MTEESISREDLRKSILNQVKKLRESGQFNSSIRTQGETDEKLSTMEAKSMIYLYSEVISLGILCQLYKDNFNDFWIDGKEDSYNLLESRVRNYISKRLTD